MAWRWSACIPPLFALSLMLFGMGAAAEPVRVCTVVRPPYALLAVDGRTVVGRHAERVQAAMKRAGYQISIDAVTWERCLRDLADGYYAAAFSASLRDDRLLYAVYPRAALGSFRFVAVVRRGDGRGWDARRRYAELPQPIAGPHGWAATEVLRQHSGLVVDDSSTHNVQDIRKLLAGRVGSVVLEFQSARELLSLFDQGGVLEILDEPIQSEEKYYMIFSRKALGDEGARLMAERFSTALLAGEDRNLRR